MFLYLTTVQLNVSTIACRNTLVTNIMHDWGDETFDWEGLDSAIRFIATNLVRWGRINVRDYKEKWGTARIACTLGWYQFHSITHPRSCFRRYPRWLWKLDCRYGSKICKVLFWWVVPYHCWLYRTVYWLACQRWANLKTEICCSADYPELLRGLWNETTV